jgi:MFS family permease
MALSCIEVGIIGVIAGKAFDANALVITTITATPAIANALTALWTHALTGRDRVRAVTLFQLIIAASLVSMALLPQGGAWVWALIGLMLIARFAMTGIYAARTDIWRSNFPRSERAKVTSRITVIISSVMSVTAIVIGSALDYADRSHEGVGSVFSAIFIACALISLLGAWSFSHIRWRRGPLTMREEREPASDHEKRIASPLGMLHVLRSDRDFRRYMTAQFVIGVPNLAAIAPFIIATNERMNLGYTRSFILTTVLTLALPIVSMPLWARLLDRMHVIRFRVFHSWFFVAANVLMGVGIITESYTTLVIARAILGIAFGGGILAWNLGHHDFAPKRLARVYMGVHVTLTGIRGVFAPFLGTLLYAGGSLTLGTFAIALPAMGGWAFLALASISTWGALLFFQLNRTVNKEQAR